MENKSLELLAETYNCPELKELDGVYPVPVGEICKRLGIKASYHDMPQEESGKVFIENNNCFIHVNYNHAPNRRRFTVAHELGHYCLHKDFLDSEGIIMERNGFTSMGIDEREIEANNFAAELLIPREQVASQLMLNKSKIELAEHFFVSQLTLNIRLANLGVNIGDTE